MFGSSCDANLYISNCTSRRQTTGSMKMKFSLFFSSRPFSFLPVRKEINHSQSLDLLPGLILCSIEPGSIFKWILLFDLLFVIVVINLFLIYITERGGRGEEKRTKRIEHRNLIDRSVSWWKFPFCLLSLESGWRTLKHITNLYENNNLIGKE